MADDFECAKYEDDPCEESWEDHSFEAIHAIRGMWKPLVSVAELETWYHTVHIRLPIQPQLPEVTAQQLRFARLKKEWIRGTERFSNLSQIILHPAYQQIIAMGPSVIPLILETLESETDHWFWALNVLNEGHDVADGAETIQAAATAWLDWGKEKGYLGSRK